MANFRIGIVAVLCGASWACGGDSDAEEAARGWDPEGGAKTGAKDGSDDAGGRPNKPTQSCTPKTCQELGKGEQDDGCGRTLDCGAVACTDAKAGNASRNSASDLGTLSDSPSSSRVVADLTLGDGQEDWFKLKVTDGGFGSNPLVTASVPPAFDVSVYYLCDSSPDYSECGDANGTQDNTIGKGCGATGKVSLATDCSGIDETGTAFVRIRKTAADGQCSMYALSIKVE